MSLVGHKDRRQAAAAAYARYGPALIRKAERILRNGDDANDVVQTLFVELMTRKSVKMELPYLYRAVTNRCLNFLRDHSNRQRLLDREASALQTAPVIRGDEAVIGSELLLRLTQSMDRKAFEVFVCHFFDDMSQEEIAAHLGTSRRTVGKRLKSVRQRIAALTAEDRPGVRLD